MNLKKSEERKKRESMEGGKGKNYCNYNLKTFITVSENI